MCVTSATQGRSCAHVGAGCICIKRSNCWVPFVRSLAGCFAAKGSPGTFAQLAVRGGGLTMEQGSPPHRPLLENQFERRQLARQTHAQRWPPGFRSPSMAVAGIEGPQHQGRPPRKSQAEFARRRLLFGLWVALPPRPPDWRLLSGSCASDRVVASGFLPTTPRGAAVAVRLGVSRS